MANRVFALKETRGSFEVSGIVNSVEKERFYTSKTTKTGKDFRAVNFGCEYDKKKSVYLNLTGMPQQNVYFSRRVDGKTETKPVLWANRNKFHEDGFRMIGVNLGLTKTMNDEGKTVNDKKTMVPYDACEYINKNLKDDSSVFIRGNIDFSSYLDNDGNIHRSVKYVPNQISLCKDVDFDEFDGLDKKPTNNFTQTIIFTGIEKEQDEAGKDTGRFVVYAKIVTYSDIVDTQFIVVDQKLASAFKKNMKAYYAMQVSGRIEAVHAVQTVSEEDAWGEVNPMDRVNSPSRIEMIITGAKPSTIDKDTYSEKNVAEAIKKIRAAQTAEQNFTGKASAAVDTGWGMDTEDEDGEDPWDV